MKLSVIIPVYNVKKYLDECVQSVLKQNLTDFELLLINDGSTDHSGKLCDEYAAADNRVRVFHKENGGVSSARNLGIENAAGEWITFIDSDDYILNSFFSALCDDNNADLIMQGFEYMESGICIKEYTYDPEVLSREDFMLKYNLYPDFSSSWSKFFRNSILKAQIIKFNTKLSFGEDTLFNLKYLQFCNEIATTNRSRYSYRIVGGGLSNTVVDYRHDLLFYKESRSLLL
jgi:glycosyltransferase involved in cell wall biosynthesis